MTLRNFLRLVLIIAMIPALLIGYVFFDERVLQPILHERNTARGQAFNVAELSDGMVQIHQLAFWVESDGRRIKVWSELACARKWKTAPKTFKAPGYSRLTHIGLNPAEVRFATTPDTDFVATPRASSVCHLVASYERGLPMVLTPNSYTISVEPSTEACRDFIGAAPRDPASFVFGPLQVRRTRTVPMTEVFSHDAYAPDAVDMALSQTPETVVPDLSTHMDKLDRSLCW